MTSQTHGISKTKYDKASLISEIKRLKRQHDALIVAHNYQIPEIQDLADYVGDSLGLSRQSALSDKKIIVFCGVHFMAETAAIFSPEKMILIPDLQAGCSLAASIDVSELKKWKKKYPDAVVVSYVNTSVEVKAESDYCCTSTNAVDIVNAIPKEKRILFIPDMFLGQYVAKITGRDIIIYPGECHVHARVRFSDMQKKIQHYPNSDFLIHPECGCVTNCMHHLASGDLDANSTYILSTGGMVKHAKKSNKKQFVVATEVGMLYPLRKENPEKEFIPLRSDMICEYMKMINLPKLRDSLKYLQYQVKVEKKVATKAYVPIRRMYEISKIKK
ncbi:quinolinate synthase [Candidatus Roizmanbacteria bacterium RIFCSPHIGHO2_02_FULL_37_13b]|uniref:Quinolinate synthase n=1 Tax=Candidatus Roizmanbacteria bacterium RIFCSPLOWO2_02_FULL_36_11 TaxID=1802071 RepID=A0A1F7JBD2_9BACT|nr:MAG: quinolinate synthase [Candidatus Roizmanbacteria bacterium RIFCSPHIGHO2_02_FULL_37_13b]OGK52928.1 MAG: quinolinate synthase [Candidatus Roizmanbacteria bacterium RIFCSPLOWO2_02_FULL_36_11]